MISEFLFKLLDGIGPLDRFGSLVVISDELVERAFEVLRAEKVVGLQVFALKDTEPDFDLIKPGSIGSHVLSPPSLSSLVGFVKLGNHL